MHTLQTQIGKHKLLSLEVSLSVKGSLRFIIQHSELPITLAAGADTGFQNGGGGGGDPGNW